MAYSASTGFRLRKSLYGVELPAGLQFRAANSATLKIGDAVRINTAGFLVRAGAGNPVAGILTGLYDNNGLNLFALGAATVGATLTADDQVVTASDNQTRTTGHVIGEVVCDPAGALLWYNDADGDLAATNDFQLFDVVAASSQISQSTASDTSGQFQLVSRDPDGDSDASKGLFRITECQLITEVNNADAVNVA